ncbi:MAG: iron-sulfur cluster carrier protein ApbC [Dehalococcoidia bacterium]|nr:MAG: iron-sulfur cluster carrier protein ApbC [Dehalococcoidia bacterium]
MMSVTEADVLRVLSTIEDPDLHRNIVSLGFVQKPEISGDVVNVRIVLTTPACPVRETMEAAAREAILALPGVREANVTMEANVAQHRGAGAKPVEGVKNIVAIASNKGGVGKSTVAANLAVALAKLGARVGLLDADITGPNIPTMMGVEQGAQAEGKGGLQAVERHGVKVLSLGFVLPRGAPIVWRGPMIGTAVRQLLHDIPWGELDYLLVDLPPGTSDASMSMVQEAPISGVVIVSTPQDVALEDASKAVTMFDKLNVPIFGIIENMSYFVCPHCGERTEIFGHGGARDAAEGLGLEFLGELPLDPATRKAADAGEPIVASAPDSPQTAAFLEVAKQVAARCSVLEYATAGA